MSDTDKTPKAADDAASEVSAPATPEAPQPEPSPIEQPAEPEPQAPEPAPVPTPETAATAPAPVVVTRGGRGAAVVAWLALLLVLLMAGGLYWFYPQMQYREQRIADKMEQLEQTIADASRRLETATSQKDDTQRELRQANRQLEQQMDSELRALRQGDRDLDARLAALNTSMNAELDRQRQEMAQLGAQDQQDWSFAESRYLMRLANQRLIMAGDVESAQALLSSADRILRDVDDPALIPVRSAIASDLASLRAVPSIDTEGLYLQLSALINQADQLVIFRLDDVATEVGPADGETWQERLEQGYEAGLQKLSSYIVVRRRDVPYEALMDPQWESLVRQNLRMLLEQSQVALLSGNQQTFSESLRRASRWAGEFFVADEARTAALMRELDQMADATVAVTLPDITRSMQLMDEALKQRLRQGSQE